MPEPQEKQRHWAPAFAGATILLLAAIGGWLLLRPSTPPPREAPAPQPKAGPPAQVLKALARGVNLSNWLQQGRAKEAARYAPDADDWQRIRALGLGHVRLPVDPSALLNDRGLPNAVAIGELRAAIDDAQREGLLVVLTLQLPPEHKAAVAEREADRIALAGIWRVLAAELRDLSPAQLAFEPLNEPEIDNPGASRELMAFLAGELRAAAPRHTLVVSGHGYSDLAALEALTPLDDPNVVYAFHFYEPHNFTHQGATWGDPAWKTLRNFPYPSSPEAVAARLGAAPPKARELLKWHGEQRWNREHIGRELERAAAWGRRHQVPVWCSEFGVLKKHVAVDDRAAWLRDVREALEARGIAWTHWDYAGPFGIAGGVRGKRSEDAKAIEALGLKQ
jgi:endoglucanase